MATKQQFILPNWAHYVSHWVSSISISFSMRDNIAIIFLQSIYAHTDTHKKIQLLPTICFLLSNKRFFTVCNHAVFPNIDSMAITVCIT